MDKADYEAERKIACPVMVLWGDKSHVETSRPREVWPRYASNIVAMQSVQSGHYPQEQAAEQVYQALYRFLKN